jgi:uncharacterized protein
MQSKKQSASKPSPGRAHLLWGLLIGIVFGFLLQKGGATKYDVIVGQLLLRDFTVLRIMLTAVLTGMIGIHAMKAAGWIALSPKPGSLSMNIVGGLLFGAGFALLGYCPGTIAGAVGNGYLDAAVAGLVGIVIGSGIFAALYPKLAPGVLSKGDFGAMTLPQLLKVNDWVVVVPAALILGLLLLWLKGAGA